MSPLLERTAAILADSARLLMEIEDTIAPLLSRPWHVGQDAMSPTNVRASAASLQKFDLLSQTLEDLSFWLHDLAKEASMHISGTLEPETAMARLSLADLRQRLLGATLSQSKEARSEPVLF